MCKRTKPLISTLFSSNILTLKSKLPYYVYLAAADTLEHVKQTSQRMFRGSLIQKFHCLAWKILIFFPETRPWFNWAVRILVLRLGQPLKKYSTFNENIFGFISYFRSYLVQNE